jgi:hypothetical protein
MTSAFVVRAVANAAVTVLFSFIFLMLNEYDLPFCRGRFVFGAPFTVRDSIRYPFLGVTVYETLPPELMLLDDEGEIEPFRAPDIFAVTLYRFAAWATNCLSALAL